MRLLAADPCNDNGRAVRFATSVGNEQVQPPVTRPAPELLFTQAAFIVVSAKATPSVVNNSVARPTARLIAEQMTGPIVSGMAPRPGTARSI